MKKMDIMKDKNLIFDTIRYSLICYGLVMAFNLALLLINPPNKEILKSLDWFIKNYTLLYFLIPIFLGVIIAILNRIGSRY
jgi:hypothetical protein